MMRRLCGLSFGALALCTLPSGTACAQQAITVTGHVSSSEAPIRGATVRIEELGLGASTNTDGRYSFIIPSTRVRGQKVVLSVTYPRYRKQTVEILLSGLSIVHDFELSSETSPLPAPAAKPVAGAPAAVVTALPPGVPSAVPLTGPVTEFFPVQRAVITGAIVDSSALSESAGLVGLSSALAGRVAGLDVQTSSALGGTASMVIRGARTFAGLTQPLVVVDGVIIDNSNIASSAQRAGLGGIDYGTTISDLNLEDIASVDVLRGPAATLRYGGMAANGIILVTTKSARNLNAFEVSASQQISSSSLARVADYQNSYGQGSRGLFAFFDGKGGGINDATDESWGPLLNGAPVVQASLAEARRGDVRAFLPVPSNVNDYYQSGRTFATTVALQSGNATSHYRAAVSNRLNSGLTPGGNVTQRSAVFAGESTPFSRLAMGASVQLHSDRSENLPGSGFDESNTTSTFSHMPRQINVALYKTLLHDASGAPLSWNYSGRNNPWFASELNDNHDDRSRFIGGGHVTLLLNDWLSASASGGGDRSSDTRNFTVAPGWMGGFPYYLGRGDFSLGGFQADDITRSNVNLDVALTATPHTTGPVGVSITAGAGAANNALTTIVRGSDKPLDANTPAALTSTARARNLGAFGNGTLTLRDAVSVTAGVRRESVTPAGTSAASTVYPAVLASVDFVKLPAHRSPDPLVESFVLSGGWSKSGNSATASLLQRLGVNTASALVAQTSLPEVTTGWEGGASMRMLRGRISADVAVYADRSTNLFLPDATLTRTGVVSNSGVEASVTVIPVRTADDLEWSVEGNFAHNANRVDSVSAGLTSIPLGPGFTNVSIVARTGQPLGTLVGTRFLRDSRGVLLLRDGLPLADTVAGPVVLGASAPRWTGGIASTIRKSLVSFSVLLDARQGGKIFSASNRAGAVSGVLAETAFRPDSGYLLSGVDVASSSPNIKHVSAEDYYHALGAIAERWVYDASYVKLREARLTLALPLQFVPGVRAQSARLSLIGRNLRTWSNVPNIDPETVLSTSTFQGAELGQLPSARTLGLQLSLTP